MSICIADRCAYVQLEVLLKHMLIHY